MNLVTRLSSSIKIVGTVPVNIPMKQQSQGFYCNSPKRREASDRYAVTDEDIARKAQKGTR